MNDGTLTQEILPELCVLYSAGGVWEHLLVDVPQPGSLHGLSPAQTPLL